MPQSKKTILTEMDKIFGTASAGMAEELSRVRRIVKQSHCKISREFTSIGEGIFEGVRIKISVEPEREIDE